MYFTTDDYNVFTKANSSDKSDEMKKRRSCLRGKLLETEIKKPKWFGFKWKANVNIFEVDTQLIGNFCNRLMMPVYDIFTK